MSADLLVRLRRSAMAPDSLLAQAADEIERLRAASGAKPLATRRHAEAINALLSVATAAYDAMDNSVERANAAGGEDAEYIIQGNDFTALSAAMDKIDALPDDRPGYTLSGGARASWALRDLFTAPPAPHVERDAALTTEQIDAIANTFNWHNARCCGVHYRFARAIIAAQQEPKS